MARIEIYDDWGKLADTINIVSADPHDLLEYVTAGLGTGDYYKCVGCQKFDHETALATSEDGEYRCSKCETER